MQNHENAFSLFKSEDKDKKKCFGKINNFTAKHEIQKEKTNNEKIDYKNDKLYTDINNSG